MAGAGSQHQRLQVTGGAAETYMGARVQVWKRGCTCSAFVGAARGGHVQEFRDHGHGCWLEQIHCKEGAWGLLELASVCSGGAAARVWSKRAVSERLGCEGTRGRAAARLGRAAWR